MEKLVLISLKKQTNKQVIKQAILGSRGQINFKEAWDIWLSVTSLSVSLTVLAVKRQTKELWLTNDD